MSQEYSTVVGVFSVSGRKLIASAAAAAVAGSLVITSSALAGSKREAKTGAIALLLRLLPHTKFPPIEGERDGVQYWVKNLTLSQFHVKEEHAQICKQELLILWTDYFKPEHLAKHPDLHDTFWKAAKLCSKNKQSVDAKAAADLQAAVKSISDIFAATKK